jgi:hypothetical protein
VLAFAFACGSSVDVPGGAGGAGGASSGGSMAQPNGGAQSSGGATAAGGSTSGGAVTAGASTGGKPGGGSASGAGASTGGAAAGSGNTSGSSGATAGGGSGGCTKNLDCKLDPPPSTGDLQQDCVNRINQFLTECACLPALERATDREDCANQMAKYDADHNKAHAGFSDGICESGGSQNSCPGYGSNQQVIGLCLQQMWDEGPPPTSECSGDCYQMHGHFINMTDAKVKRVACGFFTTAAGKVWAVQNFSR